MDTARRAGSARLRRHRPGLRRLLAAGLVAAAAAVALPVLAPSPAPRVTVVVAAHDLPAGRLLAPGDLRRAGWTPGTAPGGTSSTPTALVGRTLSGPLTAGSAVTEATLLGPGLLTGQEAGLVAVPVPVPDLAPGLVGPGDRIDVLASAGADPVAVTGAVVLASPSPSSAVRSWADGGPASGGTSTVLVVGVRPDQAARLVRAQAAGPLSLAVRPR